MLSICFSSGLVIVYGYWNSLKLWARLSAVGIWRNSRVEDVALSPPGCLARWALLSQACISAASRRVRCPGIQCFWKLAVSQALVAKSVKLALDNNNPNALLCKSLSRGFDDRVGYSSCKQTFMCTKNAVVFWVPANKQRTEQMLPYSGINK